MPKRTPHAGATVAYSTRNLRADLHERLKAHAAARQTTQEDVLNLALEVGLDRLERTKGTTR